MMVHGEIGEKCLDGGGEPRKGHGPCPAVVAGADTLTYDNNGSLTYDGTQAYAYDAWNRLMTISHAFRDGTGVHAGRVSQSNAYDAEGRRTSRAISNTGNDDGTYHYYYSGHQALEKRDGSQDLVQQYAYGLTYIDEIVQLGFTGDPTTETSCDSFYWLLQDANYNVIAAVDPYYNSPESGPVARELTGKKSHRSWEDTSG